MENRLCLLNSNKLIPCIQENSYQSIIYKNKNKIVSIFIVKKSLILTNYVFYIIAFFFLSHKTKYQKIKKQNQNKK